jgi:NADPH:quinone reductase-like Zn-dependent oxidoreductase
VEAMLHTLFKSYGQPTDVIELTESSSPELSPGEVRIRMLASPVNPADINLIQGVYGIRPELPATAGVEGTGEIIESRSETLKVGDRVILIAHVGTWSEEVVCPASSALKIPTNTPVEQACMLKVNPLTAWCMLTQILDLPKGAWVIQNAANSGVGVCVIQIAKLFGLRTINLVRREELIPDLLALGADHVFLDQKESVEPIKKLTSDAPSRLALNAVGGDSALRMMDMLAPEGQHVTYGAMSRRSLKVPNSFLIFKQIQLRGFWVTKWLKEQAEADVKEAYEQLAKWMIDGKLTQPIDATFPLQEVTQAITRAMEDKRDGKVLITMTKG